MKSQVLHTVWCNMTGEATGEIWTWSLFGVKGLIMPITIWDDAEYVYDLLLYSAALAVHLSTAYSPYFRAIIWLGFLRPACLERCLTQPKILSIWQCTVIASIWRSAHMTWQDIQDRGRITRWPKAKPTPEAVILRSEASKTITHRWLDPINKRYHTIVRACAFTSTKTVCWESRPKKKTRRHRGYTLFYRAVSGCCKKMHLSQHSLCMRKVCTRDEIIYRLSQNLYGHCDQRWPTVWRQKRISAVSDRDRIPLSYLSAERWISIEKIDPTKAGCRFKRGTLLP